MIDTDAYKCYSILQSIALEKELIFDCTLLHDVMYDEHRAKTAQPQMLIYTNVNRFWSLA
jgi:hypothetical protein